MQNTEKMKLLAEKLGQLNNDGKVKGRTANSKGHAVIIQLCQGCSVWVIHEKDDSLQITLEFTKAAKESKAKGIICEDSIQKFKELFPDAKEFMRELSQSNSKNGWGLNVGNKKIDELYGMIDTLKRRF